MTGGDLFAYQITGGSNLDLPDRAVTPDGREVSLEKDVYPKYDIILCISTFFGDRAADRLREAVRFFAARRCTA